MALALRKLGAAGVVYDITRGAAGNACTCPDHQARGAHCKHLRTLEACGLLPSSKPRRNGGAR